MCPHGTLICPYLQGSPQGARCDAGHDLIRNIRDVTIRICMSRRYEACSLYRSSLVTSSISQKVTEG